MEMSSSSSSSSSSSNSGNSGGGGNHGGRRETQREGEREHVAEQEEEEEEFPLIARARAMRAKRMQHHMQHKQQIEQREEQEQLQQETQQDVPSAMEGTGGTEETEETGGRASARQASGRRASARRVSGRRTNARAGGGAGWRADGGPGRRVQCRVVVPGTMASPEPPLSRGRAQAGRPREALKERGLNRMGSGSPSGSALGRARDWSSAPRAGADRGVLAAPAAAASASLVPAPPASSWEAPTLVKAEFNDVCVRMARIGREVNDLILRGCYLSQQTMMDAEANHRSAFRIAAEPLVEVGAEAAGAQATEATETSVETEGGRTENGDADTQHTTHPTPISPVYRLASHADHEPHPKLFNPENTLGLIARGFSLSRLPEDEGGVNIAGIADIAGTQSRPEAQTFLERASCRGLETVRRIFLAWRRRTWVRICVAQRLGGIGGAGGGSGGSRNGAHMRLGNKRPFDAAAVFARDGKHRMAREWRERRMKRVCMAKLMVHLVGRGEEEAEVAAAAAEEEEEEEEEEEATQSEIEEEERERAPPARVGAALNV